VIAYAEARSALARAIAGRTSLERARRELDAVWTEIARLEVDEETALAAGALAERHRLRGMDALHLAAALRYADASRPEPVVLVSWDRDQRAAAVAAGLEVLPKTL
jgi:hypothetical protein